jgi:hypothetical protein
MDLGQGQQEKARLGLHSSLCGLFLVKIYTYEGENKSKSKQMAGKATNFEQGS